MTGTGQPLIVVGVDGSDESLEALRWAVGYAKAAGGSIKAIRTWHYPWAMQTAPEQIDESVSDRIRRELDDAFTKSGVDTTGLAVERATIEGHASAVLIKESGAADVLVVGNKGHGAFAGMLIGSVSQHCVHGATCPVVVVRSKE
jgi:nucleotide-binding universal stress UspA family protein